MVLLCLCKNEAGVAAGSGSAEYGSEEKTEAECRVGLQG